MNRSPEIGLIGLGVMGHALGQNMADHGLSVVGYDSSREALQRAATGDPPLATAGSLDDLLGRLTPPRIVVVLVPAGPAVDELLAALMPRLARGDVVVDGCNSHYRDTQRRTAKLEQQGIALLGTGISGGEEGARRGPCVMAGGTSEGWRKAEVLWSAIAARAEGACCVAHVGPDGAGHFVKMVHNGIEYADMQLIAEIYLLLRNAVGLPDERIGEIFARWNRGKLASYLLGISAEILTMTDPHTGAPVLDAIRDVAGQKGTGRWAAQAALELGVAAPTLIEAVTARALSEQHQARTRLARPAESPPRRSAAAADRSAEWLEEALVAGRLAAYSQGFDLLRAASSDSGWELPLAKIARIWQGGCIIRAAVLGAIASACDDELDQTGLLGCASVATLMEDDLASLRRAVTLATQARVPVPCLASALSWLDGFRTARLSANLLQAQRDYFGAHGFGRLDRLGVHHLDGSES